MKTITQQKENTVFESMKKSEGFTNAMQSPKLEKVVISTGTGRVIDNARKDFIKERMMQITGRVPADCPAKKSIASFKVRQGKSIGLKVTLRGKDMYNFIEKLIHIVLPRTRDFRGIPRTSVDDAGNLTIGVKEHTVFTETSQDEIRSTFGLAITIVSTAKTKSQAINFYEHLGFPFKK